MWNQSTDFSQNRKKQTKNAISIQDWATQRARLSKPDRPEAGARDRPIGLQGRAVRGCRSMEIPWMWRHSRRIWRCA